MLRGTYLELGHLGKFYLMATYCKITTFTKQAESVPIIIFFQKLLAYIAYAATSRFIVIGV